MRMKFFTIPALDSSETEAILNRFLAQHRVTSVDRELISERSGAYWAVCVTYLDGREPQPAASGKGTVDYREVLAPQEFEAFAELRRLRKELAERDGVPLYAVFTNQQLASMVQKRVRTNEDLGGLPGVGPARVAKYGPAFLERLDFLLPSLPTQGSSDETDGDSPG